MNQQRALNGSPERLNTSLYASGGRRSQSHRTLSPSNISSEWEGGGPDSAFPCENFTPEQAHTSASRITNTPTAKRRKGLFEGVPEKAPVPIALHPHMLHQACGLQQEQPNERIFSPHSPLRTRHRRDTDHDCEQSLEQDFQWADEVARFAQIIKTKSLHPEIAEFVQAFAAKAQGRLEIISRKVQSRRERPASPHASLFSSIDRHARSSLQMDNHAAQTEKCTQVRSPARLHPQTRLPLQPQPQALQRSRSEPPTSQVQPQGLPTRSVSMPMQQSRQLSPARPTNPAVHPNLSNSVGNMHRGLPSELPLPPVAQFQHTHESSHQPQILSQTHSHSNTQAAQTSKPPVPTPPGMRPLRLSEATVPTPVQQSQTQQGPQEGSQASVAASVATAYETARWKEIFGRIVQVLKRDDIRQKVMAKEIGFSGSTLSTMIHGKYRHTKEGHVTQLRNWLLRRERAFCVLVMKQLFQLGMDVRALAVEASIPHEQLNSWMDFSMTLSNRDIVDKAIIKALNAASGSQVTYRVPCQFQPQTAQLHMQRQIEQLQSHMRLHVGRTVVAPTQRQAHQNQNHIPVSAVTQRSAGSQLPSLPVLDGPHFAASVQRNSPFPSEHVQLHALAQAQSTANGFTFSPTEDR